MTQAITEYAAPNPQWESWFADYRFGALYLFPPEPILGRVNALRTLHDPPSQAICPAHVSLTVPLPGPLTEAAASEIATVVGRWAPFEVQWGPPRRYPGVTGVVLSIAPVDRLTALVNALEGCAAFAGAPARRYPFSPHMTIAEFIDEARTESLLQELLPQGLEGTWWCDAVAYAVPDGAFRFTTRRIWRFGWRREAATLPRPLGAP